MKEAPEIARFFLKKKPNVRGALLQKEPRYGIVIRNTGVLCGNDAEAPEIARLFLKKEPTFSHMNTHTHTHIHVLMHIHTCTHAHTQ